jgi:hypothetical protein
MCISAVVKTLVKAWQAPDGAENKDVWKGLQSPVRKPFKGKFALKLEVGVVSCEHVLFAKRTHAHACVCMCMPVTAHKQMTIQIQYDAYPCA